VRWLLVEWPTGNAAPVKYWLSNLPERTPIVELVGLARLRWRVEQDYREYKGGLDHFEGRGWPGWHHHVTLVSVAHGFLTLERLRSPSWWRRPDRVAAPGPAASPARLLGRRLSPVPPSRAALATPNATIPCPDLTVRTVGQEAAASTSSPNRRGTRMPRWTRRSAAS
jgi:hypothetical protein